jgi:hypothetical protein
MRPWSIALSIACCWLAMGTETARAQLPFSPNWPIAPTDTKQCATFAADLDRYQAEVSKQHEECLKAGKEDRPNLPPNSPVCSRYACQILHDLLFSDSDLNSVRVLGKRVDACYAQVKESQDRQAAQKREAEEREQADREQAARDQESAEKTRKQQEEDRRQSERTRISSTPASQGPANNPTVLPPSQQTGQPYTVDSMKVLDTPQTEQARQAAKDREQKDLHEQALNEMADPFGKSGKSASAHKSTAASDGLVDPFGNSQQVPKDSAGRDSGLADPFANADSGRSRSDKDVAEDKAKEIVWDKTEELIKEKVNYALKILDRNLEKAQTTMNSSEFKVYRAEIKEAESYLHGLSRVVESAPFIKDAWEASNDFQKGWNDFVDDCRSKGFEYVLKRLSPSASKIWEGPAGWALSITFDSSSTQTPEQDFDPMTAINNPSRYTFGEREAALRKMYVSEATHPEVWNDSKRQWLRDLTVQVYNSPDNPNIHLAPQDDPNIHLTPQ